MSETFDENSGSLAITCGSYASTSEKLPNSSKPNLSRPFLLHGLPSSFVSGNPRYHFSRDDPCSVACRSPTSSFASQPFRGNTIDRTSSAHYDLSEISLYSQSGKQSTNVSVGSFTSFSTHTANDNGLSKCDPSSFNSRVAPLSNVPTALDKHCSLPELFNKPVMPLVEDGLSSSSDLEISCSCESVQQPNSTHSKGHTLLQYSSNSNEHIENEKHDSLINPPLVRDIWGIMGELKQTLAEERTLLNKSDCMDQAAGMPGNPEASDDGSMCKRVVVQADINHMDTRGNSSSISPSSKQRLRSRDRPHFARFQNTESSHSSDQLNSTRSSTPSSNSDASPPVPHVSQTHHQLSGKGFMRQQSHENALRYHSSHVAATQAADSDESNEDTHQLLQAQCDSENPVYIPELKQEAHLQRRNRVRDVSVRHPDHPGSSITGVLFRARYLGSTQLPSTKQASQHSRMLQAQEAINRIKAPDDENQPSVTVELFVSTDRLMILNSNLQEILIDHELRLVSYIADIGELFVLMAHRSPPESTTSSTSDKDGKESTTIKQTDSYTSTPTHSPTPDTHSDNSGTDLPPRKIICHVLESSEARIISQTVGHAFQLAYLEFLHENGIDYLDTVKPLNYEDVLNQQEIFCDELSIFSDKERHKQITIPKHRGEPLGVVVVASGWGSLLPSVLLANMNPTGPAARCGQLNIGNHIISVNGQSLVGLPLNSCRQLIKACRNQTSVRLLIVDCPPVTEVLIRRPSLNFQLGFSVQDGVVCSLLRGGIAERGGIRVDHRIIEINGQSVVAVSHEKIVQLLASSVGEIHLRTMPTSVFRLLTGQETPHYI